MVSYIDTKIFGYNDWRRERAKLRLWVQIPPVATDIFLKFFLPSAECLALGKLGLCRVPVDRHSANLSFPIANHRHSAKFRFCRVPKGRHSAYTNGHQPIRRPAHVPGMCAAFAVCWPSGTRQRSCMSSALSMPRASTRQRSCVPCAVTLPSAFGRAGVAVPQARWLALKNLGPG